jgi:hypothetical protein
LHYRLMIRADPHLHTVGPRFVKIGDFTEDFDSPEDFDAWHRGRASWGNAGLAFPHPSRTGALPIPKIGRNDPCPCGSGMKFKKCCAQQSVTSGRRPRQSGNPTHPGPCGWGRP